MPGIIRVLSDAVANQIAAGEVIQRPASIVKELMENAVDAGASSITVSVKDAGKTLIQVTDNGNGMGPDDALTCFERHATSKILEAGDLFSIHTKGFRGEALASIAAVAELSMKTRREEDELGTQVRIAGSSIESTEKVQCPVGTTFQVKNLFFNIPARRKFLKSDHTELRHIINEFNHIALTHEELKCTLLHNGTEILQLSPAKLRQRILGVFGKSLNSYLIPIETETSLVKIHGYIGKAEHARKTYGEQFFFVNRRYIRHPYFHKAIMSAYDQILAPDHYPSYFIYLETDPEKIDVNIHPSKTEVKFEDEKAIWKILLASAKEAIGRNSLSPSLDFSKEGVIDIPVLTGDTEVRTPEIETNPAYNPFQEEDGYRRSKPVQPYRDERFEGWEQLFEPGPEARVQERLLQIKNKYILSPVKSGLMVIDQRRAHERIIYERMVQSLKSREHIAQQSLFPEAISLNHQDYQVCLDMMEQLSSLGFDIRDLGKGSVVIHGIPADMKSSNKGSGDMLEMLIEQFKTYEGDLKLEAGERIARSAARASAISYGEQLDPEEMQSLTDRLFASSNPNYTPSGKLIVKIIELSELDEQFNV